MSGDQRLKSGDKICFFEERAGKERKKEKEKEKRKKKKKSSAKQQGENLHTKGTLKK